MDSPPLTLRYLQLEVSIGARRALKQGKRPRRNTNGEAGPVRRSKVPRVFPAHASFVLLIKVTMQTYPKPGIWRKPPMTSLKTARG